MRHYGSPEELRYVSLVTGSNDERGVVIERAAPGSVLLRELIERAVTAFPHVFGHLPLLRDASAFRARYAELLPQFELARCGSDERAAIARWLCVEASHRLQFADDGGRSRLIDVLHRPSPPLPTRRVDLPGKLGFTPKVDFRGRVYIGDQLAHLADELSRRHFVSHAAADALRTLAGRFDGEGPLRLTGERFVLLGAGAELSPVYQLLEAGAEVLWLDRHKPPIDHLLEPQLGGAVHFVEDGIDLLTQPDAIRATVMAFANGAPVHFGLYAYASGDARALKLALTMNELLCSLPRAVVKSVNYLLSPTSPSAISREDSERAAEAQKRMTAVQRALLRTGSLSPAQIGEGECRISSSVVSQQGASYQVAEYVGKRLAAEALIEYGSALDAPPSSPVPVSAIMAPVTATRSLANPVLAAAILGAPSLDMLIAAPTTATGVASALLVHDVLAAQAAARPAEDTAEARRARTFGKQFHGGVHAQPFALDGLIRMATLRGIAQQPRLALELWR